MGWAVDHPDSGKRDVDLQFFSVQPNKWTFKSTKIRGWCESYLKGRVLNACCGPTELQHDCEVVRNDVDEDIDADHHIDARNLSGHFDHEFDTVVFDPPFSAYQANVTYNGKTTGYDTAMKREIDSVLRDGGRVIQFGYTTTCMPRYLGFDKTAVAVFQTLGRQNDILGTVDDKINHGLHQYSQQPDPDTDEEVAE